MDIGNYATQSLICTTPVGGTPDTLEIKWGTAPGTYPHVTTVPFVPVWTTALAALLPGPGVYYAKAKVSNKFGSKESAEYPFECGVGPNGVPVFSIG